MYVCVFGIAYNCMSPICKQAPTPWGKGGHVPPPTFNNGWAQEAP